MIKKKSRIQYFTVTRWRRHGSKGVSVHVNGKLWGMFNTDEEAINAIEKTGRIVSIQKRKFKKSQVPIKNPFRFVTTFKDKSGVHSYVGSTFLKRPSSATLSKTAREVYKATHIKSFKLPNWANGATLIKNPPINSGKRRVFHFLHQLYKRLGTKDPKKANIAIDIKTPAFRFPVQLYFESNEKAVRFVSVARKFLKYGIRIGQVLYRKRGI